MNASLKLRISVAAAVSSLALTALPASAASPVTWHMDEPTGSTVMRDSSGSNVNGTIDKGVRVGQPGVSGLAYRFTGNRAKVTVPSNSLLNPGNGAFNVSLSFKSSTRPTSSVGDYDLIRKGLGSTSGGDWKMEVEPSGKVFCLFGGSSRHVSITGTTNVVDGMWHRLSCVSNSSGVAVVVDGVTQAKTSRKPGNISNSAKLTIGAKDNGDDSTTGVIDEVAITKG